MSHATTLSLPDPRGEPESAHAPRAAGRRSVALALLSALAFLTVAAGISAVVRAQTYASDALAVAFGLGFGDPRVDVAFVGTSRVMYDLNPELFDRAMTRHGFTLHSYDVSVPALSFAELDDALRRSLDQHPCCARYLFIEADMAFEGVMRYPNTIRAINFYDLRNAYRTLDLIAHQRVPTGAPTSLWDHLTRDIGVAVARHYTNAGLFQIASAEPVSYLDQPTVRGYLKVDKAFADEIRRDGALRQAYDQFVRTLTEYGRNPPDYISDYEIDRFLALLAYVRAKGMQPIVLQAPYGQHAEYNTAFAARLGARCPAGPPLMNFARPDRFPELYDPANRFNVDHLNASGATLFTGEVADRFASLLKEGALSGAPACLPPPRARVDALQ